MNQVINICDKCGRVVDFPNELKTINVSYIRDDTTDWQVQLCSVCKREFNALRETFTEAKNKYCNCNSKEIAKHILEKEEDGGEQKS